MATEGPVSKIGVEVDATNAVAGLNTVATAAEQSFNRVETAAGKGKKGLSTLGDSAVPAAQGMDRATRSMVQSIERATAAFSAGSKSSSDYYRVLAQQRGVDPKILQPYLDALDKVAPKQKAVTDAVAATVPVMQKYEMSAKATAAALRQVPAQFTDIVVGLQGGQNPLTVLLQQGGQLKDIFGGAGNAARALGSYIAGLISPITIAAAGLATFGVAFYQGRKEAEEFNKALILTGNYAGATAGSLAVMADNLDNLSGVTKGSAAEALNAFVSSGQVGAAQLERFTAVALATQRATGQAVDDTVKQFVELGKDPVDASIKLNSTMHFLTLEIYNQIKALDSQGKSASAAALAQQAYADALDQRTKSLAQNLGFLERAWNGVKDAARETWDAMLNVGRASSAETEVKSLTDKLAVAQKNLDEANITGIGVSSRQAEVDKLKAALAPLQETARLKEKAAQAAAQESRDVETRAKFDRDGASTASNAVKMKKELLAAENEYGLAVKRGIISQKEYDDRLASIRAKYTDKGAVSKSGELDKASAAYDIQRIQQAMSAQADAYANGEKMLEAVRAAGLVSDADYYAAKRAYIEVNRDVQVAALDAEIAREKKRKAIGNTADERALAQIDINKKVLELEGKRQKVLADAATAADVLATQESAAAKKIADAYTEAGIAAQKYIDTIQRGYSRSIAGVGQGDESRAKASARGQIEDKYDNARNDALSKYRTSGKTNQDLEIYNKRMSQLKDAQKAELEAWEKYYSDLKEAEADWSKGASRAIENYVDASKNAAAQSAQVFTNAFKSMEDALVDFAMTGEISFKKFADGIISDLIRIEARKSIAGFLDTGKIGGFDVGGSIFDLIASTGFSYDGGGSTGNAPRSGGLDGKGGFMAMLHPQETVIDHTKGQTIGGGGGVSIVQNIQIDSRSDQATIMAAMGRAKDMALAEIMQSRQRGGAFA